MERISKLSVVTKQLNFPNNHCELAYNLALHVIRIQEIRSPQKFYDEYAIAFALSKINPKKGSISFGLKKGCQSIIPELSYKEGDKETVFAEVHDIGEYVKPAFFTDMFYNHPYLTIKVLNTLIETGNYDKGSFDMYGSGEFLSMDVKDCPESREILSALISDFEAYDAYDKGRYMGTPEGYFGLCSLQEVHDEFSPSEDWIRWDEETEKFVDLSSF